MLAINCLLKNTPAVQHIKDAIEMMVGAGIEKNGTAKFPEIYKAIREAGIEVDAESIGNIYDGIYGGYNDAAVSTTQEVEEFTGANFNRQIKSVVNDIQGKTTVSDPQEIGIDSPEKHAVNAISKMFQAEEFGTTPKTKTVLRQMQDLVTKAAQSFMDKAPKAGTNLNDSLKSFFDIDGKEFKTLSGQMNTMKDLHDAVKEQVKNYVDQAALKLENHEADILREQWDNYTKAFIDSSYDIVLGKGNQNSLVNESLKQIEVEGKNIVDLNGNVNWSALIEHDNPDTIAEKVKQVFKDGFTNKDGSTTTYTNSQAERIGDYFKRLYETKLDAAKERAQNNNRAKNMSAKNIISDFIKDRGFFNLVKDKNGNLLLTQADWTNALKSIKNQLAAANFTGKAGDKEIRGLDLVQQKLRAFLNSAKNKEGNPFTPAQKKIIEDEFVQTALAKLKPETSEPASIERLIALDKLNSSKAFNFETQQAVNKVVGVSGLNQEVLNKLQALAKAGNSILTGSVVTGSTSANPEVNRGAYAYTALAEVDRKIKEILREFKINNDGQQKAVKYIADVMGGGTVSLLLNINNAIENVNTQLFTNIAESVNMAFTNPKLFAKTFGRLQGEFWGQWMNYANGGAGNEITNESDLNSDIQSSERLRIRGAMNEIKDNGLKGLGSVIAKSPQYAVSIFSRVFMNSFDAATTTSLMRKRMIQSTYKALIDQGKSSSEVMKIMDQAFKIPDTIDKQIKIENKRIEGILTASGLPVNKTMMAQNERDMRLSVYEDVIRGEGLKVGASLKQSTEIAKALIESSQKQAKTLGGKRQIPTKGLYDILTVAINKGSEAIIYPQKALFGASRKAEEQGDLSKAAKLQLAGSVYQNFIGKFVGGVANFMNLAITATPYGFVQSGILRSQAKEYLKDNAGASDIFNGNPEDIKRYAELHGIMRSITTRAIMGSAAMAAFITKALISKGDDDNKETQDWFANLMATKTGRRFIQKHLPLGIAMAGSMIYKNNPNDHAIDKAFDMLDTYTGKDFETYGNLRKSFKFAKTDAQRNEVLGKFFGNLVTTYNVNQPEQMVKFIDVVKSMFDSDKISDVKENEAISKEVYKSAEGIIDNFLINGAIDAVRRSADPHQRYNRFSQSAKNKY